MSFVIEKDVPVPPIRRSTHQTGLKATVLSMEVGDSLFYESTAKNASQPLRQATANIYDRKYTCRTVPGGARIWRIA